MEVVKSSAKDETNTAPPSVRRSFFRDVRWRLLVVALVCAPGLLPRLLALLPLSERLIVIARAVALPVAFVIEAWMLVIPLWLAVAQIGSFPRMPSIRTVFVEGLIALVVAALVFISAIASTLAFQYFSAGGSSSGIPYAPLANSFSRLELLGFIALVMVVAPVAEEVFFRGMAYNAFRQRVHPALAVLASAGLFALCHPFGLQDSDFIVLAGLACAIVYEWRKTLVAPILVHAAVNVVGVSVLMAAVGAEAAAPRLGVGVESEAKGVRITEIVPDSAADRAGLHVGDVVKTVDGQVVKDLPSLTAVIRSKQVGDTVVVEFIRESADHRVEAILTRRKQE
jgi:membrane protease YdiL (CAAX protease family)